MKIRLHGTEDECRETVDLLGSCHHATSCPTSGSESVPLYTAWSAYDQFHIELASVRPRPDPMPCKGALGLWRLPDDVEKTVRAQL